MTLRLPSLPPRDLPIVDPNGKVNLIWYQWLTILQQTLGPGFSGTITTAKLTVGGTNGTMTFNLGVLTSEVPAT